MKFVPFNRTIENFTPTSLQGHIDISYARLVRIFGEPNSKNDGYKTDAEWCIIFEDGTLATIYNYKDGKNYNGSQGKSVAKIRDWHVGGKSTTAVQRVMQALLAK